MEPYTRDDLMRLWVERFKNHKAFHQEHETQDKDALHMAVVAMAGVIEENNKKVYEDFKKMLSDRNP